MDAIFDYEIIANNTRESSMCDGIIIKKLMSGVKGEKKVNQLIMSEQYEL